MTALAEPEWDGPDDDGWSGPASPSGGVLIVRPQGRTWVPAWTTSDGYILWRGDPCPTPEAAQQATEAEARL
jgi:hypothetical protein